MVSVITEYTIINESELSWCEYLRFRMSYYHIYACLFYRVYIEDYLKPSIFHDIHVAHV